MVLLSSENASACGCALTMRGGALCIYRSYADIHMVLSQITYGFYAYTHGSFADIHGSFADYKWILCGYHCAFVIWEFANCIWLLCGYTWRFVVWECICVWMCSHDEGLSVYIDLWRIIHGSFAAINGSCVIWECPPVNCRTSIHPSSRWLVEILKSQLVPEFTI